MTWNWYTSTSLQVQLELHGKILDTDRDSLIPILDLEVELIFIASLILDTFRDITD